MAAKRARSHAQPSGAGYRTNARQVSLRGVSEAFDIYEVREREAAAAAA